MSVLVIAPRYWAETASVSLTRPILAHMPEQQACSSHGDATRRTLWEFLNGVVQLGHGIPFVDGGVIDGIMQLEISQSC